MPSTQLNDIQLAHYLPKLSKEVRELVTLAKDQGWSFKSTSKGHVMCIPLDPKHQPVTVGSKPSTRGQTLRVIRRDFERSGLVVDPAILMYIEKEEIAQLTKKTDIGKVEKEVEVGQVADALEHAHVDRRMSRTERKKKVEGELSRSMSEAVAEAESRSKPTPEEIQHRGWAPDQPMPRPGDVENFALALIDLIDERDRLKEELMKLYAAPPVAPEPVEPVEPLLPLSEGERVVVRAMREQMLKEQAAAREQR